MNYETVSCQPNKDLLHQPITIVMGGQYGSEGKGEVVTAASMSIQSVLDRASAQYDPTGATPKHFTVYRVGGPQAGHTATIRCLPETKRTWKMRQLPCGFMCGRARLIIGPGSELEVSVLEHEIEETVAAGVYVAQGPPQVDGRATLLDECYKNREAEDGLTQRLGSTGKGIGACRADRIMRKARLVQDIPDHKLFQTLRLPMPGAVRMRNQLKSETFLRDYPGPGIIETAQGFGLSLVMSGCYPYVTSTDITPGRAMSDAGLSSRLPHRVVMVVRTYPIRVAGNSGPLPYEIDWETLHHQSQGRAPLAGEKTTVTKKVRRVARFDMAAVIAAVEACRPDALVVTFADYLDHAISDETNWALVMKSDLVRAFVHSLEDATGVEVQAIATGPGYIAPKPNTFMRSGLWEVE